MLEWDVETSQITAVCEGHQGFVRAVVVASGASAPLGQRTKLAWAKIK